MVISLRSRCEDAFTSSPGAAVIPFPPPPVIFPIPGDFPDPPGDKIISGDPHIEYRAQRVKVACSFRCTPHGGACTVRRPHAHGPVSILTSMSSCLHASLVPNVRVPSQMAANFNVKIPKCRQEVEFTKMPQLLVAVGPHSQVHGNVFGFFTFDVVIPW